MTKSPKSVGHLNLSTAEEQYDFALQRLAESVDAEWDDPTPDTMRIADHWQRRADEYASMASDEIVPLF